MDPVQYGPKYERLFLSDYTWDRIFRIPLIQWRTSNQPSEAIVDSIDAIDSNILQWLMVKFRNRLYNTAEGKTSRIF